MKNDRGSVLFNLKVLTALTALLALCFAAPAFAWDRPQWVLVDGFGNVYGRYYDRATCRMMLSTVIDGECVLER